MPPEAPIRVHSPRRRAARAALAGCIAAAGLVAAPAALADITVNVTSSTGVPVVGETVTLNDPTGFAASGTTDNRGILVIPTSALAGDPAPFTATVTVTDRCQPPGVDARRTAVSGPVPDGATLTLTLELLALCAGDAPSGQPPATGYVDTANQRVLAPPGGTADLEVRAPFSATNLTVLAGSTPIGSAPSGDVRITAPAAGYEGPLQLTYTFRGQPVSHALGTLVSKAITRPVPLPGPIDLEAIVDISGSMRGTDPRFIRRDALNLLIDLARPGDVLGAVGFDNESTTIFNPTVTGSAPVVRALRRAAQRGVVNRGGTDYNDGMDAAFSALTQPNTPVDRQKGLIFLTDGGHNAGPYQNGHLRFAYNASGRSWPVCVVQLGASRSFQPQDVARLKRIAADTGGQYFATERAGDLTDIYFRCFGRTTGQRTLSQTVFTFRPGQEKTVRRTVPPGLRQATFFAGWGNGVYQLSLVAPNGRRYRLGSVPTGAVFRRGLTFAFFRVNRPQAGVWQIILDNVRLPVPSDRARAVVSAPRR